MKKIGDWVHKESNLFKLLGCVLFILFGMMFGFSYTGLHNHSFYTFTDNIVESVEDNTEDSSAIDSTESYKNDSSFQKHTEESAETNLLYIHITGAVENPGVYRLPASTRVIDAIECAVPSSDADIHALNLAATVYDGEKIIVPVKSLVSDTKDFSGYNVRDNALLTNMININAADTNTLKELEGIGDVKAHAIVIYREEHGYFHSIEDICNVDGIGSSIFNKIKDKICV